MSRSFLSYGPTQVFLLPPSPLDWLPEDHRAYLILDVVGELEMDDYLSVYSSDGRGAPAFSPYMMVALLLYAWIHRVHSSRKVELMCHQDVGARVICGGHLPDHRTINRFRSVHDARLKELFNQSVVLCQRAGMVSLAEVAVDGSKFAANASKRKAMSYAHMVAEEERVVAEIDGYFRRAAEEDAAEDVRYGPDKTGRELPEHLRRRQSRLIKIREAKAALEAEAKAAADAKQEERAAKEAASSKPLPGRKPNLDPAPKPSAQRSFTDPESRIMKAGNGSFIQGYNAQIAVDRDFQVIVACDLSQQAADVVHAVGLTDEVSERTGFKPMKVLADGGYFSAENMQALDARGIEVLIPPDRERCGTPDAPPKPLSNEELDALKPIDQMRHRVSTKEGREAYAHRKTIVEPVFGQIKGSTGNPGFTGFLRRGLEKCTNEWGFVCACHNILKLIRFRAAKLSNTAPEITKMTVKTMPRTAIQMVMVAE